MPESRELTRDELIGQIQRQAVEIERLKSELHRWQHPVVIEEPPFDLVDDTETGDE